MTKKTNKPQYTLALLTLAVCSLMLTACEKQADSAISELNSFIAEQKVDKTKNNWKTSLSKPPKVKFSKDKTYQWHLETTEGKMVIEFLPDEAPMHVSSTIYLTLLGFYDDIKFHRVINGFMAQGGDPLGIGSGNPGYKYDGEYDGSSKHDKAGTLSMANAGQGTDGSQFFLTFTATPHLNGKHTVFGYLKDGMDVLRKIEKLGSRSGRPSKEIKIIKATVAVE
ncbi:peptidylprolyl isomerase [Marinicella litoralis]|uniref:Peptidyl-prolyl cis-trans isomerase n=1 Tax=Marinicella litoralis TaxID=644220 RepID=A0A4R6XH06_9GAMM|nr:peptidylprolyl isomerase [Marinicella litoralis]TDR17569.1 peptidylprolyl isomerase [Marinicella litoralis]